MNHRKIPAGVLAALAALAVGAPAAQAKTQSGAGAGAGVCNQATPQSLGGDLVATDGDPTPPARYQSGLEAMPGKGAGLVNAASKSPALSLCGPADGSGTTEGPAPGPVEVIDS